MTEISNIALFILILVLISSSPFSVNFYKEKLNYNQYSIFDKLSVNLLIHIYFLLLLSFTGINYLYYFIFLMMLSVLINIHYKSYNILTLNYYKNINFIFFIISNLLIYYYIARDPTLSWDGLENWYYKAQIFFYNHNFFELKDTPGADYYPHLGSFIWGFFWKNSFLQYEYYGRLVNVFIYVLSIFSICHLLKKNYFIKPIIITFLILICFDHFLFKGYQEILIFSFLIFLSKYWYLYTVNQSKSCLLICFLFLNILPWLKNEGYLFVLIFTISIIFTINKTYHKKEIIFFIVLSWILIIAKNFIFYKYLNLNVLHSGNLTPLFSFDIFINFLMLMIKGLIVAIFKYKIWFFIMFAMIYLLKIKNFDKKHLEFIIFLKVNLILYLVLMGGIYFSIIDDPRGISWWIDNSLDRILYQISGFFIISIILLIKFREDQILK